MTVQVRGPRNHFPLVSSPRYLFIAGGIGITPIVPMVDCAQQAGSDWTLIYLGRSRTTMAFGAELADAYGEHVKLWPRDEKGRFDLEAAIKDPEDHALVYCCGPEELVSAVEQTAGTGQGAACMPSDSLPRRLQPEPTLEHWRASRCCASARG
jgi:ferredoxin-NADP reductase